MRVAVALLAIAVGCHDKQTATIDAGQPKSDASASASVKASAAASDAAPPEPPPPPTDYKSLALAEAAGDRAIGKTVLISASRGALFADAVVLHPCVFDVREVRAIRAAYSSDQRALVRAMPSTIEAGHCKRTIVKITGPKSEHGYEHAALVDVVDVHPSTTPPAPPPAGVDFASTDDLLLAGDAAAGKVAQIPIRLTALPAAGAFDAQTCDVAGVALRVEYQPAQQALVDAFPSGFAPCRTVRVRPKRLTNRHDGTWLVELLN
jgi:hypothetical protein